MAGGTAYVDGQDGHQQACRHLARGRTATINRIIPSNEFEDGAMGVVVNYGPRV